MANNITTAKTKKLVQLSLLLALEVIMTFTFLGFIQIPPVSITLMHIPVIIGGILLGKTAGAILGGAFGVLSIIRATFAAAGPIDLMFNPATSGSPLASLVMAIVPRVLLGVLAAMLYDLLRDRMRSSVSLAVSAVLASLSHSLMVLFMLSFFFSAFPLIEVFAIILGLNGLLELAAAGVLCTAVCAAVAASRGKRQASRGKK